MDSTEAQKDHAESFTGQEDQPIANGDREPAAAIDGGLPDSAQQEQFSLGFVRLVASAAGCWVKTHATDYDGVDITVASSAQYEKVFGPQFELQLKCTTQHGKLHTDYVAWSMDAGPFAKLTTKRYLPAFLGILVIPPNLDLLLEHDESKLLTRSCMYWQRAELLGQITGKQKSKTVKLPRSNIFTAEQLLGIMGRLAEGGDWE